MAIADEYVHTISSRYLKKSLSCEYDIKHVKKRHFSRNFVILPWFSEFYFLTDFGASKSIVGSFFAFFAKIWPKNMYRLSQLYIPNFLFELIYLVTWDDLDLYYCHKAHEMIITNVIDKGCARLMSRESNLTRLGLKWVESELSRPWKSGIWVESESNHADRHLSQR